MRTNTGSAPGSMKRISGPPDGTVRGLPSSWMTDHRTIQVASSQPLTSDQRPLTRYPPGTTCAFPDERVLFAVIACGPG